MKKILVNNNRAEVGAQVHCLDHVVCHLCKDPNCKVFDVKYRAINGGMWNPRMLRWCEIEEKSADFPDVEPYLLDVSGPPKKVIVDIVYKAEGRHDITYDFELAAGHKISDYIHSAFNSEEGDVYGWPNVKPEAEQVDEMYSQGQRTFAFHGSYRGEQVVTVEVVEAEAYEDRRVEEWQKHEKARLDALKAKLLDDLLDCDEDDSRTAEEYREELRYIREAINRKS